MGGEKENEEMNGGNLTQNVKMETWILILPTSREKAKYVIGFLIGEGEKLSKYVRKQVRVETL